jgi:trehalose 6-phosphate phosphatase
MSLLSPAVAQVISEVEKRFTGASLFSLFLDFDGTLVPIASDPSIPRLDARSRRLLERIAAGHCCVPAIVSGRAIDDLYTRVGVEHLIYAGNHGLEIRGPGINFVEPAAAARVERLRLLSRDLTARLGPIKGALVEYKGLTASVHYRQVAPQEVSYIQQAVCAAVATEDNRFTVNCGKMVFEIVPRTNWHKGVAAQWIIQHLNLDEQSAIFFGDDTTDEKAFATLQQAITVRVGWNGSTMAGYHFPDPETVHEFLEWMADGRC